jgi:hypothetical protein
MQDLSWSSPDHLVAGDLCPLYCYPPLVRARDQDPAQRMHLVSVKLAMQTSLLVSA